MSHSRPMFVHRFLPIAVASAAIAFVASSARADEAACIAASENEVSMRKAGRLQEALKQLAVCASPTCSSEVNAECTKRIGEVKEALPTVVVRATDSGGNDLTDVKVTLDGLPFASTLDGRAIPIDPGKHVLRFESAGKPPLERTLLFAEGEKDRRVTVVLGQSGAAPVEPVSVAPVVPPSSVPATEPGPVVAPANPSASSRGGGVRSAGFVVGGVGVAGVIVGGILGGLAIAKVSSSKGECVPANNCNANTNPAATQDMQTAGTFADASTGLLVGGGVLAAAGVVMVLVGGAPKERAGALWISPVVTARGGSLAITGVW
jgi:hypothetical protein